MKKVLIAALMLGGCTMFSGRVEPFITPDGKAGYIAYCGGEFQKMTTCYDAARKQCSGDYQVIQQIEAERSDGGQRRRMEFLCAAAG